MARDEHAQEQDDGHPNDRIHRHDSHRPGYDHHDRHRHDDHRADARPGPEPWQAPGYTYRRELGSGASGRVVQARHDATDTPVAIKHLLPSVAGFALRQEAEVNRGRPRDPRDPMVLSSLALCC